MDFRYDYLNKHDLKRDTMYVVVYTVSWNVQQVSLHVPRRLSRSGSEQECDRHSKDAGDRLRTTSTQLGLWDESVDQHEEIKVYYKWRGISIKVEHVTISFLLIVPLDESCSWVRRDQLFGLDRLGTQWNRFLLGGRGRGLISSRTWMTCIRLKIGHFNSTIFFWTIRNTI